MYPSHYIYASQMGSFLFWAFSDDGADTKQRCEKDSHMTILDVMQTSLVYLNCRNIYH